MNIRVAFQEHFAQQDDRRMSAAVNDLEKKLQAVMVTHELYRYPGQHGFFNEQCRVFYGAHGAQQAWQRMLAFRKAHVRRRFRDGAAPLAPFCVCP